MLKTEWTIATWANRASAAYVAIDKHISNIIVDAYGRKCGTNGYASGTPRRPVKMEEGNPAYVMYDSDDEGAVPIIRISEEEE